MSLSRGNFTAAFIILKKFRVFSIIILNNCNFDSKTSKHLLNLWLFWYVSNEKSLLLSQKNVYDFKDFLEKKLDLLKIQISTKKFLLTDFGIYYQTIKRKFQTYALEFLYQASDFSFRNLPRTFVSRLLHFVSHFLKQNNICCKFWANLSV